MFFILVFKQKELIIFNLLFSFLIFTTQNPITRFIMKHFNESHQECYERTMHMMYEETRKAKILELQDRILELMKNRQDHAEFYHVPFNAEHTYDKRVLNEFIEEPLYDLQEEDKEKMREGKFGKKFYLKKNNTPLLPYT